MALYRAILTLLAPFIAAMFLWRRATGTESARSLRERLGRGEAPKSDTSSDTVTLWLHGASNGELTSARWLIEAMLKRAPDLAMIVTCNTETARRMVEGWDLPRVTAAIAPLDYRFALRRFLARHRPAALATLEGEFWPNRIVMAAEAGLPVLVLGARMSERSARRYGFAAAITGPVMRRIAFLSAQDAASEARFRSLGVPLAHIGPVLNLKAQGPGAHNGQSLQAIPETLRAAFHPGATLLAASTHPGEEAVVLKAFALAREAGSVTRLILAPRHPRRRLEIEALIRAADLAFATRSLGQEPGAAHVYLADTMGEMELWYRLAGVTLVGGSLVPNGGHTPYEPARYGSALLHGPHVSNFTDIYRALDREGGARQVTDAPTLAAALRDLADTTRRVRMAGIAHDVLAGQGRGGEAALFLALSRALDLPELRS